MTRVVCSREGAHHTSMRTAGCVPGAMEAVSADGVLLVVAERGLTHGQRKRLRGHVNG
jgi:hypothetical protein